MEHVMVHVISIACILVRVDAIMIVVPRAKAHATTHACIPVRGIVRAPALARQWVQLRHLLRLHVMDVTTLVRILVKMVAKQPVKAVAKRHVKMDVRIVATLVARVVVRQAVRESVTKGVRIPAIQVVKVIAKEDALGHAVLDALVVRVVAVPDVTIHALAVAREVA